MISVRRRITCQEFVGFVSDYIDGVLAPRARRLVDRHLAGCAGCQNFLAQLRLTVRLAGTLKIDEVPAELLDALERASIEHHGDVDPHR